jgi:hypothetical protein
LKIIIHSNFELQYQFKIHSLLSSVPLQTANFVGGSYTISPHFLPFENELNGLTSHQVDSTGQHLYQLFNPVLLLYSGNIHLEIRRLQNDENEWSVRAIVDLCRFVPELRLPFSIPIIQRNVSAVTVGTTTISIELMYPMNGIFLYAIDVELLSRVRIGGVIDYDATIVRVCCKKIGYSCIYIPFVNVEHDSNNTAMTVNFSRMDTRLEITFSEPTKNEGYVVFPRRNILNYRDYIVAPRSL